MGNRIASEAVELLQKLGFTELEAATYLALLKVSPATAYQVAKTSGRPIANTYKAIDSLAAKGAVARGSSGKQLCSAVDPAELLERLRAQQEHVTRHLGELLKEVHPAPTDPRVYQIEEIDAVYMRAQAMIRGAKVAVLIDAFPESLRRLAPDLTAAARRGVRVIAQTYAGERVPRVKCVGFARAADLLAREPGQIMTLCADRGEVLLALTSHDQRAVFQAVYSASRFLASMIHAYLGSEISTSHALTDDAFRADFMARVASLQAGVVNAAEPLVLTDIPRPRRR